MRELPRSAQRGEHLRTDPDYAPRVETFDNLSHRELHAAVSLLDPAALNAGGQLWRGSAAGVAAAVEAAGAEVRAAMADGWRGPAAANAAAAVAAFEQRGRALAEVMGVVGERLGRAGDAAETVRAGVGAPVGGEPDLAAALLDPGSAAANVAAQKAAETARLDVVRVMEDVYAGAFLPTGNGVPAFPEFDVPGGVAAVSSAEAEVGGATGGAAGATPGAAPVALATDTGDDNADAGIAAAPEDSATPEEDPASPAESAGSESAPEPVATQAAGIAPPGAVPASFTGNPLPHNAVPNTAVPHLAGSTAPVSTTAPGVIPPTVPADDRKKQQEERRAAKPRESSGTEAVTGLGAGAMGGLLGGALAASETTRPGHGISAHLPPRPPADDPDDDLHFPDEELTYLEPGDDNGRLIGSLEPTTPPVLGEWSERE